MRAHFGITFMLPVLALSLFVATAQPADNSDGIASCDRGERDRDAAPAGCRIAWAFEESSRAFYWVERLEAAPNENGWVSESGPFRERSGVTEEPVEGGFLYRVVACNDLDHEQCAGSTAVWVPSVPADINAVPEFLDTADGTYTARSTAFPQEFQIVQYNLALLAQLVSYVDDSLLPRMTQPAVLDLHDVPAGVALWDARMDYNIYMFYPVH